ncbi:glycoside hydrolase family 13 protein [Massilia sp. TS11]|uniref:glycoside hydrolase family 13 protein n=1 Tax=Massilia sp. TS11 TaxID=2908003 RepID=UPI001EDB5173|nr:glycoside hydrolase family 13 protein [Massilia sp. TS11]MCG2583721.1 glycoside hydrolase family 13 protein [Massilia sp. TS11]
MKRTALALLLSLALPAFAQNIDRMEPPFWWTGFKDKNLQLMVHGPAIGEATPSLDYPGVRIASVTRTPNKNYLFVNLVIDDGAKPGTLDLRFTRDGKSSSYAYSLRAREPGSAQRKGFGQADVIYNLMPDRFANGDTKNDDLPGMLEKANRANRDGRHGGDIAGIIQHLDYLAGMGFTQLWPTPFAENNMPAYSYHGYAATDFYKMDPRFGSNEDYVRLSKEARARGIGLIQDIVLSHLGSQHWWLKDLPMPDWLNNPNKFTPTAHHRAANQDPYRAQADYDNFTRGWFVETMPDMNQSNPFVATYQIQNSLWWIEYAGLSGLRLDTFGYSDSAFLTQYTKRVMDEYPNLTMVGEEWSRNPVFVSHWQTGKQNFDGYRSYMPSMMDFPMSETLREALAPAADANSLKDVYEMLAMDQLYPDPSKLVMFEGNHDMARLYSVVGEDLGRWKIALAALFTLPRIPQFYYGTEVLMTSTVKGRDDASYRHDMPGGWEGDKVNAFTGAGLTPRQTEAQAYVRRLANWRKANPVIHSGKTMHFGAENGVYVYFRYDERKRVMVVLNKSDKAAELDTARFQEILRGSRAGVDVISGERVNLAGKLKAPATSALILELDKAEK